MDASLERTRITMQTARVVNDLVQHAHTIHWPTICREAERILGPDKVMEVAAYVTLLAWMEATDAEEPWT